MRNKYCIIRVFDRIELFAQFKPSEEREAVAFARGLWAKFGPHSCSIMRTYWDLDGLRLQFDGELTPSEVKEYLDDHNTDPIILSEESHE